MTYQVLARKWRPQDFSSLVGQEPIVTALRNALTEGRIAQAYLFSGIRGVGKTTAARVLAKALNCERGPAADPCNECVTCLEITRGSDLDVIEVDAATYSKVEQVRELTESLRYGPARDRYKVVVLDEVHRLSRQAFDALLKIVEEPPPHLLFIFATTEIEAVPATILSRCQEFHFRRVTSQDVAALLRRICAAEEIRASDAALRMIARAGEGSVRDAVALLDQLATFGSGEIADEDAVRLLGGLDTALFARLLAAILGGDAAGVREIVRRVEDEGWDPRHLYGQFLAFCRDALHLSLGGDVSEVDLPVEEAEALAAAARETGYENLLRLMNQLLASESVVRRTETGVLAVEIAWLRAAELPKLTRIEEILASRVPGAGAASPPPRPSTTPAARPAPAPTRRETAPPHPPPAEERARPAVEASPSPRPAAPAPRPEPGPAPPPAAVGDRGDRGDRVEVFLGEVDRRKPPLAARLKEAEIRPEGGEVLILYPPEQADFEPALMRGSNPRILDESVSATWGGGVRWRAAKGSGRRAETAGPADEPAPAIDTAATDPTVQTILELFGGTIERVEEHGA